MDLIQTRGFAVFPLDKTADFDHDAAFTAAAAKRSAAKFVLTDLGTVDNIKRKAQFERYFSLLQNAGPKTVVIDDFDKVDVPVAAQIVPYFGAEKIDYRRFADTRYMLGADYFICGPEQAARGSRERPIAETVRKIFISLGGSDPTGLTVDAIDALEALALTDTTIKVAVGACFSNDLKSTLARMAKDSTPAVELCATADVPNLLLWADLAITAIGLTRYEAALAGTPSICLTRDDLKKYNNDPFIQAGTSKHLSIPDDTHQDYLAKGINDILGDYTQRRDMSTTGRRLIDGRGAERIISELKKTNLL